MSNKQSSKTTKITGNVGKVSASLSTTTSTTQPAFLYGCQFCGRQNVVSAPGNSCGRSSCNEAWNKQHGGVRGAGRFFKKAAGY